MTFIALNSLINGSTNQLFRALFIFFFNEVIPSLWRIIIAPLINPSMMWIVTPLIISMSLVQLYFARHRDEELGWGTAFENSIALIFVSINLLQHLYNNYGLKGFDVINPTTNKIYLIIFIALISLVQLFINYYHLIPKKIAFLVNSSIPTNITAYFAIIIVYTSTPFDLSTMFAYIILLAILFYAFNKARGLVPMSERAAKYITLMKEKALKKKAWLAKLSLRQERAEGALLSDAIISAFIVVLTVTGLTIAELYISIPSILNKIIQSVIYLITLVAIMIKRKLRVKNLNYDGESREIIIGALIGIPLFIAITGLIYILWFLIPVNEQLTLSMINSGINKDNPLLMLLTYFLLVPVSSELLFRGLIQRSIKARIGRKAGVHVQALLFSITCINSVMISSNYALITVPLVYVSGMTLGYLREKWGLESSLGSHMTFNLIGLLLLFFGGNS